MTFAARHALPLAMAALLATSASADARARRSPALPGADEVLHFLGTEPFWGGEVRGGRMVLDWPENEKGVSIRVRRGVARGRLTLTGALTVHPHFLPAGRFTMIVVRKNCGDGMSERTYPYDVTILARGTRLLGCGYTARRPLREAPDG
jgi:uncharacterized membrane protein